MPQAAYRKNLILMSEIKLNLQSTEEISQIFVIFAKSSCEWLIHPASTLLILSSLPLALCFWNYAWWYINNSLQSSNCNPYQ